jgi:predicted nuclease of predicted toxin-antitoxin system
VKGLLCDENVPRAVIEAIAAAGLATVLVRDVMRGAHDEDVAAFAEQAGYAILTEDRRFGQIGLATGMPANGVIVMAMGDASPREKAQRLTACLNDVLPTLAGALFVVTPARVRRRPLRK